MLLPRWCAHRTSSARALARTRNSSACRATRDHRTSGSSRDSPRLAQPGRRDRRDRSRRSCGSTAWPRGARRALLIRTMCRGSTTAPRAIEPPVDAPHAFASPWQLPDARADRSGRLAVPAAGARTRGLCGVGGRARGRRASSPTSWLRRSCICCSRGCASTRRIRLWTLAAAFRLKPEATQSPSRDLRGFRLQAEGCEVASTWLTTCRRYLRRRARIGLASLVASAGAPGHHAHTRRRLLPAERSRRADPARRARRRSRMGPVVRSSRGVSITEIDRGTDRSTRCGLELAGRAGVRRALPCRAGAGQRAGGAVARRAARGSRDVARRPPGCVCRLAEGPASRGSAARRARVGDRL